MESDKEQIKNSEAKAALDSVEKTKKSSLKRALPPHWYNAVLAVLAGTLVFLAVMNHREYQVLIILLMGIVIAYQIQSSGISTKPVSIKHVVMAILCLVPLYFLLVIAGQYLTPILGDLLGAFLAGTLLAAFVYLLAMAERKKYS